MADTLLTYEAPLDQETLPQEETLGQGPSLTFQDQAPKPTVPRNKEEVATQLAVANDDTADIKSGILKYLGEMDSYGQFPLHQVVWEQRRNKELDAARQMVDNLVSQGDSEGAANIMNTIDQKYGKLVGKADIYEGSAKEAIENLSYVSQDRNENFLDSVDTAAARMASSNMLQQNIAEAINVVKDQVGIWNTVTDFAGMLAPGGHYSAAVNAMNSVTGKTGTWNKYTSNRELVNALAGMDASQQKAVLRQLTEAALGPYAVTRNPVATLRLLQELLTYTKNDYLLDVGTEALNATVLSDVVAVARTAVRAGKAVKVVADTAGKEASAKIVAGDLVNGTQHAGLNDAEKVSAALSSGRLPYELDPAAVAGLSSEAQTALKESQIKLYNELQNRLVSSGLPDPEIKKALADIREKYNPSTNKSISSVTFGVGDELGQNSTVYWQSGDGRSFATREAAEKFAKERGMVNYSIVEKSTPDAQINLNLSDEDVDMIADAKSDLDGIYTRAEADRDIPRLEEVREQFKNIDQLEKLLAKKSLTPTQEGKVLQLQERLEAYLSKNSMSFEESNRIPLWEGDNLFEYSSGISTEVKGMVEGLSKIFGMNKPTAVSYFDDFPLFARRDVRLNTQIDRVAAVSSSKGAHTVLDLGDDIGHLILLKRGQRPDQLAYTIAHEMGHAFDRQFLSVNPKVRNEMSTRFSEWMIAKGYSKDAENFRNWLAQRTSLADREDVTSRLISGNMRGMKDIPPQFRTWITQFDEYWADQFAKFAFTDAKPVGVVEQYFKGLVDYMKKAYAFIAGKLGLKVDPSKASPRVAEFLREHMKFVEEGRTIERATFEDVLRVDQNPETIQGKPRIKLKLPDQDKIAGDPVGFLVKEQRLDPIKYTEDGFTKSDIDSMPWIAVDPKHGASDLLVEERVIGIHAEAKLRKDFTKFLQPFYDKLSKREMERVNAVLTEGDAYSDVSGKLGREFNTRELKEKGLNEKEITAYMATRQMRMMMWQARNSEMVRHLAAQGYREFHVTVNNKGVGTITRVPAKMVNESDYASLGNKIVYDARTGSTIKLTQDVRDELRRTGAYVAELAQPQKLGKTMHRYAVGHPDHTRMRDITTAVPYRPGEFSRIYTDEYFITAKRSGAVDGESLEWTDTIRTAKSEGEAQRFVKDLNNAIKITKSVLAGKLVVRDFEAVLEREIGSYFDPRDFIQAVRGGEFDDVIGLDFHYTRNKEEYLNGSVNEAISSGRTFVSKRGERLYSVDRRRDNTLDVQGALQAEMANVSRVLSISQWRENAIRRWMNSFGDLVPNRSGNDVADFFKAVNMKFSKRGQDQVFAERTHAYIMRQLGVKTDEERMYDNVIRGMTEKYLGDQEFDSIGAWIRQKSFLGMMRNVNFNLTLGMWNPAQLIVQANGAATALSLSPVHGLAAAKTFPLLRLALMSDRPDVWKAVGKLQKWSDMGLSNADEFADLARMVHRSGILDNLKSTSLFNMEEGATNIFRGYGAKVWGTQAAFFNRGEEFSRVVSYDVARREWKKAHPDGDWRSDAAQKEIVKRMDDLTQNMTRANLAGFQQGILSIPTQFLQYNVKLAANVMSAILQGKGGRGFSRAEAVQLLTGHLILYGAAGNGLSWVIDEMMGEDNKESLSVEAKTYLAQGVIAGLINSISEHYTGQSTSIAVGSRLGTFDYYQRLAEAAFFDPANIWEALGGPTYSTASRIGVVADVASLWYKDPDVTGKDVIEGLSKITKEQVATLRNATKAYIYYQNEGKMTDKRGNAVGRVNQSEILAAAIGFQPTVAQDTYRMYQSLTAHKQTLNDLANTISLVQKDIMLELGKDTDAGRQRAADKKKLLQALWPDNAADHLEVQKLIREKVYPYDTQFQKLIGEHVYKGYNYEQPLTVTNEPRKDW